MFKLIAVFCGLFLLGVGLIATFKTQQEDPQDRSISSLARRTKSQGKTKLSVPGDIIEYPGMNMGLDEALEKYSAVVVEPVESKSYIGDNFDDIRTAYRFKIVEVISQRSAVFCNACPPLKDVTGKFQPALSNEFIMELSGGTVIVDGVEVTMTRDIPNFDAGKRYLLIVSFTPGGMAKLAAGPSGIFLIQPDDSLQSISKGNPRIPDEIGRRFSKSLSKFRHAKP